MSMPRAKATYMTRQNRRNRASEVSAKTTAKNQVRKLKTSRISRNLALKDA